MWKEEIKEEHLVILKATKSLLYSYAIKTLLGDSNYFNDILSFYKDFYYTFVISCHNKKEERIASISGFDEVVKDHPSMKSLAEKALNSQEGIGEFVSTMLDHITEEENRWLNNLDGDYSEVLEEVEREIGEDVHRNYVIKANEIFSKIMDNYSIIDTIQHKVKRDKVILVTGLDPERLHKVKRKVKVGEDLWIAEV
ncbi:hypothetical protein BFU36_07580 [Sulfolobus sp. A20]|uniref:hypothetical protein n=1 Tax=Sulfolobaceae TaxID=118883 RepID=UPI000845EAD0|nr:MULTISPECIES: hypothetical protein [unclassified Sulfolobus]TRM74964.1 hypothetical protein DJ528_09825 [Sulfolobus sp. B5]TRM76390.1 hypothetical protein DJ532_07695 [Sulfolobus sp. A20-N-F8]TRM83876.1 hypothetical protein DJ531_03215 [Sulfolobus sp. A20-N-F6]TRM84867.1 hypothetical protein DJ522_03055 [Sulfolobus sp. F3]TRM88308.1 hypothetical protein DJ521_02095 [Sulfolobus sp. E3]TRM89471.1 hypothetical protein DJ529_02010 [Sulfolobus sp. C3]TRM92838.1 hypothetical protein DJ526_04990